MFSSSSLTALRQSPHLIPRLNNLPQLYPHSLLAASTGNTEVKQYTPTPQPRRGSWQSLHLNCYTQAENSFQEHCTVNLVCPFLAQHELVFAFICSIKETGPAIVIGGRLHNFANLDLDKIS
jgi:hypothetical protein